MWHLDHAEERKKNLQHKECLSDIESIIAKGSRSEVNKWGWLCAYSCVGQFWLRLQGIG